MHYRELPSIAKVAFLELVKNCSEFHGRTYSYFEPVANKSMGYNILLADNATGFSVCIPLKKKDLHAIQKSDLQVIMKKIMEQLISTIKKYPKVGKPINYDDVPLKAGQKTSLPDTKENLGQATVNCYVWSKLLVNNVQPYTDL